MIRSGRVAFHPALQPFLIDIDSIQPAPWNYNNGDVEAIEESIERWGMFSVLRYQTATRDIIAGNHTWLACKGLDAAVIPAIDLDVDDVTAKAMAVEDNETARRSVPDLAHLLTLVDEVHSETGEYLASINQRNVEAITKALDMPLRFEPPKGWPTLALTVPPSLVKAFRHLTREADNDTDRFELLLRLAGWDGE